MDKAAEEHTQTQRRPAEDACRAAFEKTLQRAQPGWLQQQRQSAWADWQRLGWPGTGDELWLHTDTDSLQQAAFTDTPATDAPVEAAQVNALSFDQTQWPRLVLVDGRYRPDLSDLRRLPDGVRVQSLQAAAEADDARVKEYLGRIAADGDHALCALNTALWSDGALLHAERNADVDTPLLVLHLSSGQGTTTHSRLLLIADESSRLQVVTRHVALTDAGYFANVVSEVVVADNADCTLVKVQDESAAAFHFDYTQARTGRDSRFQSHVAHLGGRHVRHDVRVSLDGENAWAKLGGLHMLNGAQHVDTDLRVDHAQPHGESHELYKSILDDTARSAFRGRVHVHRGAQKTDAYQRNENLLLSEAARAWADPQLEIYADDVKCSHGATVGRLDETSLFYLRSRGVPEPAARSLLVFAFAGEVLAGIPLEPVQAAVRRQVLRRLPEVVGME